MLKIFFYFSLLNLYSQFNASATHGGIFTNLTTTILKEFEITHPSSKVEQQKIANCLTSLDSLISLETQKLDGLKTHKKWLMQNLFPQEGETFPKVRFPGFSGEWVEVKINDITSTITDYVANGSFQALRENVLFKENKDYALYVRLMDLRAGLGHSSQKYVDERSYQFLNKTALYGGELLIANIGANVGEIWQMPHLKAPATLAPNMIMMKFKHAIESKLIFYYLQSAIGQKRLSSAIAGSGHPKLSKTDLRQVKVQIPRFQEQQKIAYFLTSLDNLINAQSGKIDSLKTHKKGLMQQLFFSSEMLNE